MYLQPEIIIEKTSIMRGTKEMGIYLTRPKDEHIRPVLLLIQEAFGVNSHIQDVCHRFARQGYVVVSPDLYYQLGQWKEIDVNDRAEVMKGINSINEEQVTKDLEAALDFIMKLENANHENVGIIGYCLGGKLAYHAAAVLPERVKCAAVYYGGGITKKNEQFPVAPIERTDNMKAPLIGFFGGKDSMIPIEDVELIDRELEKNGVVHQIHLYPDASHGFYNDTREGFHLQASQDAWSRTLNWFEMYLER